MTKVKPSLVSHTKVERRLIIIDLLQETMGVLCLDHHLLDGVVVDTESHALHLRIAVVRILSLTGIGIILLITSEDIHLLVVVTHILNLREDVVTGLNTDGICILADKSGVLIR